MLEYSIIGAEDGGPTVSKLMVEYTQKPDCDSGDDDWQVIRLESVDNGCAPFIRISMPEDGCGFWSIEDGVDLEKLVQDFNERLNYKEK